MYIMNVNYEKFNVNHEIQSTVIHGNVYNIST